MTDTIVRPRSTADGQRPQEDPRLASRRHQVRAAARRRRLSILIVIGVVVLLAVGGVMVTRSALLDVDHVAVVGATTVPRARIIDASGVSTGDPLVSVDATTARRRIMALPGVASARVAVEWPDTVRIRVTEEQALARVVLPDGAFEVARGGRVVGRATGDGPGLPTLTTTAVAAAALQPGRDVPQVLGDALIVFEQMPASLQAPMAHATLAADGSLSFALAGIGGTVQFGPPEEVPAKLLAAASMLDGRVVTACLDVLDVREPTRPTISRTAGCTLAPPTVGATTVPKGTRTTPTTAPKAAKNTPGTVGRTTVPSSRTTPTTTSGVSAKAATTTTVARGR